VPPGIDDAVPRFYRPRNPAASPFFKVVTGHFDPSTSLRAGAFERSYPDLFQSRYGFWRPVIRRILTHCALWKVVSVRPPPVQLSAEPVSPEMEDAGDYMPEYDVFEDGGQTE